MSPHSHLTEQYVSPWVLPGEQIIGWIRSDKAPTKATLRFEQNVRVDRLLNIHERVFRDGPLAQSYEIAKEDFQVPGFMGFEVRYDIIPDAERELHFSWDLTFDDCVEKVDLSTKLMRPMLTLHESVPSNIDVTSQNPFPPPIQLMLGNEGKADPIGLEAFLDISARRDLQLGIVKTSREETFGENLRTFARSGEGEQTVLVRGKGIGILRLGLRYRDRLQNTYETTSYETFLNIQVPEPVRIPLANQLEGDQPTLSIQAKVSK